MKKVQFQLIPQVKFFELSLEERGMKFASALTVRIDRANRRKDKTDKQRWRKQLRHRQKRRHLETILRRERRWSNNLTLATLLSTIKDVTNSCYRRFHRR